MNPIRLAALSAYTTFTLPRRRARMQQMAASATCPISALFYHRVADSIQNDWTISTSKFLRHIDYCQANLEIIDLVELQRRVVEQTSNSAAVTITFDDGYRDNLEFAIPLLLERQIPFTYFVTTKHIKQQVPFSHDVAAGQPLGVHTVDEIAKLADAGVEIGCHSHSHIDFSTVRDPKVLRQEILESKIELEQVIGKRIRYFAFPFGLPQQLTQAAIEAVHDAGFDGFCSAFGGYNLTGQDAFHIRRIHGDPEFARLKNWLLFDPRKSINEPRVRYFLPPTETFESLCGSPAAHLAQ